MASQSSISGNVTKPDVADVDGTWTSNIRFCREQVNQNVEEEPEKSDFGH
jgi:hypothetical protein